MGTKKSFVLRHKSLVRTLQYFKRVSLPGFGGVPIYYVVQFFFKGITEGYITTRAAAVSFNLFIAIFPAIIFLFSLIPFVPIENFQQQLILELIYIAPDVFDTFFESTILDIIENQNSGVMSLVFILALYFSTTGVNSMISAFSLTYHQPFVSARSWISQQLTAIWITIVLSFLLISGIGLTIFGEYLIEYFFDYLLDIEADYLTIIHFARWLIIVAFIYLSVAFIYYYGPKKEKGKKHVRFLSPGAILATTAIIGATLLFTLYLENFDSYNKLYGSIGTIMGLMILIYINCIAIILGYELNVAIAGLKNTDHITGLKLPEEEILRIAEAADKEEKGEEI